MCKLFSTVGIPYNKENDLIIQTLLANHQNDGLGHAHLTYNQFSKGCQLNTFKAFDSDYALDCYRYQPPPEDSLSKWQATGIRGQHTLASIYHSRTGTNEHSLKATHPFSVIPDKAFIHNGIISIPTDNSYPVQSKNDSEYLAHDYHNKGLDALSDATKGGYLAIMELDSTNRTLTIARDSTASLYWCQSVRNNTSGLNMFIFATLKDDIDAYIEERKLLGIFTKPQPFKEGARWIIDFVNLKPVVAEDSFEIKKLQVVRSSGWDKSLSYTGKSYHNRKFDDFGDDDLYEGYGAKRCSWEPKEDDDLKVGGIIQHENDIWDEAYNQGLDDGFEEAKQFYKIK